MEDKKTTREYLSQMDKKLDRLTVIMLGDQEAKQDGLVHKVQKHADYIRNDKKFKWGVATLLFGGTGGFLTWIKTHLGI